MKRLLLISSLTLLAISCSNNNMLIQNAVDSQMSQYPESRLQDLYKSFFQDRFGPAHLITNRQGALDYILSELAEADTLVGPYCEPVGWEGRHVRVSLLAVKDGGISADELTDAFVESASPVTDDKLGAWKEEWREILQVIEKRYPDIPGLAEDKHAIDSLLQTGQYAMHHSREYNMAYHPHYRLVRKDIAEKLLGE